MNQNIRKLLKTVGAVAAGLMLSSAYASRYEMPTLESFQEKAQGFGAKLTAPSFPDTREAIEAEMTSIIQSLQAAGDGIAALELENLTFETTFGALDRAEHEAYARALPINVVKNTSPDVAVRDAATEAMKRFDDALIAFAYRYDIYENLRNFVDRRPKFEGEDLRLMQDVMLDYKRLGYDLSEDDRKQLERMNKELAALTTDFSRNISEADDVIVFTLKELEGVPEGFLKQKDLMNAYGTYDIRPGVAPQYQTVMRTAKQAETRRRLMDARFKQAKDENLPILAKMVQLRFDIARKLGYKTWADYQTEKRMAGNGNRVKTFLTDMVSGLEPRFKQDVEHLRQLKVKETGDNAAVLHMWDLSYYKNQYIKDAFAIDREEMRRYFPLQPTLEGLFEVYGIVFGLEIQEIENPDPWFDDVALYVVSDNKTRQPLGLFYLDMFPREGKYNHFAQFTIVPGARMSEDTYQRPTVGLICNFPPPGEESPSLLSFDEVNTLFHEFGHCMHSILTEAKYARFAGTQVPQDFVETPSQVLEYWLTDKHVLDLFAGDWQDRDKKIPQDLIDKLDMAENALIGLDYRAQMSYALIDMELHHHQNMAYVQRNMVEMTNDIMKEVYFAPPSGSAMIANFGHLAGYDAGYYGYAWADVIAADLAESFRVSPGGFFDKDLGAQLRREIFSRGNSRDVNESVRAFLGRDYSVVPFLKRIEARTVSE